MNCSQFQPIAGGVVAPRGFVAGGTWCDIKGTGTPSKEDLAILLSEFPCTSAAVFTTNRVCAAPVHLSRLHLQNSVGRAVVANSGNANACTGAQGMDDARRMAQKVAAVFQVREQEVFVCSTGLIGIPLPIERIEAGIERLKGELSREDGSSRASRAIMTSDKKPKETAVEFSVGGTPLRIGGIAKGAGMICPQMATMLCFITTDATVEKEHLQRALQLAVDQSFNCIIVDGDMSTNDTVIALANASQNAPKLLPETPEFTAFQEALNQVCLQLALMIVGDGEGVTKVIEVAVINAASEEDARMAGRSTASSQLVKCSWFGADPNWSRIMDAIGYSGAVVEEGKVRIFYDDLLVAEHGRGAQTSQDQQRAIEEIAARDRFRVTIDLGLGNASHTTYGTDLSPDYVTYNAMKYS